MTFSPRTWSVGEVVGADYMNTEIRDQFNSMFAAWTTYTPTWTGATTNPAIGNGSLVGRYMKVGRRVDLHIDLVCGSTTTYGSGAWTFGLPFTAAAGSGNRVLGAHAFLSARVAGQLLTTPGAANGLLYFPASTSVSFLSSASATVPITWASTAQLRISGSYETAS
ncbi:MULTISPECIES: hypothetical protein [Actinomycetes]|uniref:hypothetical protein n=1 Tax=Actinomycetes TaxID=1760 RepID=UPI0033E2743E